MNLLARLGLAAPAVTAQADAPLTPTSGAGILSPWTPQPTHLEGLVWSELLGLQHRPVDRRMAMSMPALAKARNLLCATGAGLPFTARTADGPIPAPFIEQPERGRPALITYAWIIDALLWYGRAWLVVTDRYAEDNRPRFARWVPEWEATTDQLGNLTEANGVPVTPSAVIRIDAHHEGLLNFAAPAIREAEAIARATMNAARNPVPSVELHQTGGDPLTPEQIEQLRAQWGRARQGEHGGVAFTNQSIEAKMHGQSAEQLLLGARNAIALDLARSAGVPAWLVDAATEGSSLTYSNTPQRSREFIDYGLMPYLSCIAARLSMDDVLPRGISAGHDVSRLLRADFAGRMEAYKTAAEAGIYTAEELRAMERDLARETTR